MPTIVELIAVTAGVTQFIKVALEKVKVVIGGKAAVVLSVVCSIGVVLYFVITLGLPFDFSLIPIVIQVAIGANAGYSLLKVSRPKP